jgi:hypothetical protein
MSTIALIVLCREIPHYSISGLNGIKSGQTAIASGLNGIKSGQTTLWVRQFRGTETDTLRIRQFGGTETDTANWTHP